MNNSKVLSYSIGILLTLVGIGAVAAGLGLLLEPDGGGVGLPLDLLANSPFEDFLIPGIVLFAVNGIASLIGAVLAFRKHRYTGIATMVLGFAMLIWISTQVYWIGWQSWMQPAFLAVGLAEVVLGLGFITQSLGHGLFNRHPKSHAH